MRGTAFGVSDASSLTRRDTRVDEARDNTSNDPSKPRHGAWPGWADLMPGPPHFDNYLTHLSEFQCRRTLVRSKEAGGRLDCLPGINTHEAREAASPRRDLP